MRLTLFSKLDLKRRWIRLSNCFQKRELLFSFQQPWPRRLRTYVVYHSRTQYWLRLQRMLKAQLSLISSKVTLLLRIHQRSSSFSSPSWKRTWRRKLWFSCPAVTQSSFIVTFWTTLISQWRTSMESKSSRRGHRPILNILKLRVEFCCAQMLLREALTSLMLIGLCNSIHQMIQKITFIELDVLQEVQVERVEHSCLFMSTSLVSLGFWSNPKLGQMSTSSQIISLLMFKSNSWNLLRRTIT